MISSRRVPLGTFPVGTDLETAHERHGALPSLVQRRAPAPSSGDAHITTRRTHVRHVRTRAWSSQQSGAAFFVCEIRSSACAKRIQSAAPVRRHMRGTNEPESRRHGGGHAYRRRVECARRSCSSVTPRALRAIVTRTNPRTAVTAARRCISGVQDVRESPDSSRYSF